MQTFEVQTFDKDEGQERWVRVMATTVEEATDKALKAGWIVGAVRPIPSQSGDRSESSNARRPNPTRSQRARAKKSASTAAVLNLILPGAGYYYIEAEWGTGVLVLPILMIYRAFAAPDAVGTLSPLIVYFLASVITSWHAYHLTNEARRL